MKRWLARTNPPYEWFFGLGFLFLFTVDLVGRTGEKHSFLWYAFSISIILFVLVDLIVRNLLKALIFWMGSPSRDAPEERRPKETGTKEE